jgi:hypothetical protein
MYKTDVLIETLINPYIKENYPNYVDFLKQYFYYNETEHGPLYVLDNIPKYIDISLVPESMFEEVVYQYANSFPNDVLNKIDVRTFIKNSKVFYTTKGTLDSFRFIFNLLGGKLNFYFPQDNIFTISETSVLSGENKIHDNKYYAFYTYEIETDLDQSVYRDLILNTVHPSGFRFFSKKVNFLTTNGDEIVAIGNIKTDNANFMHKNIFMHTYMTFMSNEFGQDISGDIILNGSRPFVEIISTNKFISQYINMNARTFDKFYSFYEIGLYKISEFGDYTFNYIESNKNISFDFQFDGETEII